MVELTPSAKTGLNLWKQYWQHCLVNIASIWRDAVGGGKGWPVIGVCGI